MFGSRLYGQVAGVGGADQGVGVAGVTAVREAEGAGHARYTSCYGLGHSEGGAGGGVGRCRWIWNESVTRSQKAHREGEACGAARLDRMLTQARAVTPWLARAPRWCSSRPSATSPPPAQSAQGHQGPAAPETAGGPARHKKKREAQPTLNYTRRGFRLKDGPLHLAGGIVLTVVWSRALPAEPSSVRVYRDPLGAWYCSFVVPAPRRAASGDGCGDRHRLGREGDRHYRLRRPRPPPRPARPQGPAETVPLRPDDGPPPTEERPARRRRATGRRRSGGRREKDLPAREGAGRGRVPVTVTCRVLKLARQPYLPLARPAGDRRRAGGCASRECAVRRPTARIPSSATAS